MHSGDVLLPWIEVGYKSQGAQEFIINSRRIAAVSVPTWYDYIQTISGLPNDFAPNDVIVSPERITSPGSLEQIPYIIDEIERRIEEAQWHSQFLTAQLLLGTVMSNGGKLSSSVIALSGCTQLWTCHKQFSLSEAEGEIFDLKASNHRKNGADDGLAVLISEDIFAVASAAVRAQILDDELSKNELNNALDPRADTLILVGSGGVHRAWHEGADEATLAVRHRETVEKVGRIILGARPNITDIVMVERRSDSGDNNPCTTHIKRAA